MVGFQSSSKTFFVLSVLSICAQISDCASNCGLTVHSNYTDQGSFVEVNGLKIYESTDKTPTRLIFVSYDIFGFRENNNCRQVADKVAQAGFRISMPDFFRNKTYSIPDSFAPELLADAETILKDLITHYKAEGVKEFGIFGFCWGGFVAYKICTKLDEIKAGALLHPAAKNNPVDRITTDDANALKSPLFLMPSMNEPDMTGFYNIMVTKFGKDKVGHRRFDDMKHGFAGKGGDFEDPLIKKRVVGALKILRKYFNQRLPK